MEIKIGFSRSSLKFPWFSWLIRLYERTSFSHVYVEIDTKIVNQLTIFQSSRGMVNCISETEFYKRNQKVVEFTINLTYSQYKNLLNSLHSELGKKYAFLQNIGIVLVDMGIWKSNKFKDGYNCSELIYSNVLQKLGFTLDKHPDLITPKDIYKLLQINKLKQAL